jgi:hypothetical protein
MPESPVGGWLGESVTEPEWLQTQTDWHSRSLSDGCTQRRLLVTSKQWPAYDFKQPASPLYLFYWRNPSRSEVKTDFSDDFRLSRRFDINFGPICSGSKVPSQIYYHVSKVRFEDGVAMRETHSKNFRNCFNTDTICFLTCRKRI